MSALMKRVIALSLGACFLAYSAYVYTAGTRVFEQRLEARPR